MVDSKLDQPLLGIELRGKSGVSDDAAIEKQGSISTKSLALMTHLANSAVINNLSQVGAEFSDEIKEINDSLTLYHPETAVILDFQGKVVISEDQQWAYGTGSGGNLEVVHLASKKYKSFKIMQGKEPVTNRIFFFLTSTTIETEESKATYLLAATNDGKIIKVSVEALQNKYHEERKEESAPKQEEEKKEAAPPKPIFIQADKVYSHHKKMIRNIKCSKMSSFVYSADEEGNVFRWSVDVDEEPELLYNQGDSVNALDISKDEKHLISAGKNLFVKVFNLETRREETLLGPMPDPIWTVKFSPKKNIAAGTWKGEVRLWEWDTWNLKQIFQGNEKSTTGIEFIYDEEYLITTSNDTTVRIWSVDTGESNVVLKNHKREVIDLHVRGDKFYTVARDKRLLVWTLPQLSDEVRIPAHTNEIVRLCYSHRHSLYFSFAGDRKVMVWDATNNNKVTEFAVDGWGLYMCLTPDEDYVITCSKNKKLVFWEMLTWTPKFYNIPDGSSVSCMRFSSDGSLFLTGDEKFKVKVIEYSSPAELPIKSQFGSHQNQITALAIKDDNSIAFSGSEAGHIIAHNLVTLEEAPMQGHTESVSAIEVISYKNLLLSSSFDKTVRLWNIEKKHCMKIIEHHTDRVCGLYITKDKFNLFINSLDKTVTLWDLHSLSLITSFDVKEGGRCLTVSDDEKTMYISQGKDLSTRANPLQTKFGLYGPGKNYFAFMGYIKSLMREEKTKYIPELDKWTIMPNKIAPMHLFAFYNLPGHLRESFIKNSTFFVTASGENPLSLALVRKFTECVNTILLGFCSKIEYNPFEVSVVSKHIIDLNRGGFKALDSFYQNLLSPARSTFLPKFCLNTVSIPIIVQSPNPSVMPDNFIPMDQYKNEGQAIAFLRSPISLNTIAGSQQSITFLESLLECSNKEVLRSKFINVLLDQKWRNIRFILITQAIVFVIYLILLSTYTLGYLYDKDFLIPIFTVNFLLLMYEIYQMFVCGFGYFKEVWNYFDLFRCILTIIYSYLVWDDDHGDVTQSLLVILTLVSWVRGITFFSIFEDTRYMIQLLTEVFMDIKSFLMLLFYSTMAFAFVFISIEVSKNPDSEFGSFLSNSYLLDLGDFSTSSFSGLEWTIFFIASVINPLVMMNLLISIIGDTYDRVQEGIVIADKMELIELILEGETLLFWRRNLTGNVYLQMLTYNEEEEEEGWLGKVREITTRIGKMGEIMEESIENNGKQFEKIDHELTVLRENLDEKIAGLSVQINSKMKYLEEIILKSTGQSS